MTDNRGNQELNGNHVTGCFEKAKSLNLTIFSVQMDSRGGTDCWTSPDAYTYQKYGPSDRCDGVGGVGVGLYLSNAVYKVKGRILKIGETP